MKSNITLFLLLFANVVLAQQKVSFPDKNAYWSQLHSVMANGRTENPMGVIGDTLINNVKYIKIGQSNDSTFNDINNTTFICGVRELDSRYYFLYPGDNKEYLLYDFNLNVGDTVISTNPWAYNDRIIKVNSIDTIVLNGISRKRLSLNVTTGGWQTEQWIEGIGSSFGLIYQGYYVFDGYYQLLCFHQNDSIVYLNSPNDQCYYDYASVYELPEQANFSISPNPAQENVNFNYNGTQFKSYQIDIIDLTGRKVLTTTAVYGQNKLDVSKLKSGVYSYIFYGENNPLARGKFVVE